MQNNLVVEIDRKFITRVAYPAIFSAFTLVNTLGCGGRIESGTGVNLGTVEPTPTTIPFPSPTILPKEYNYPALVVYLRQHPEAQETVDQAIQRNHGIALLTVQSKEKALDGQKLWIRMTRVNVPPELWLEPEFEMQIKQVAVNHTTMFEVGSCHDGYLVESSLDGIDYGRTYILRPRGLAWVVFDFMDDSFQIGCVASPKTAP